MGPASRRNVTGFPALWKPETEKRILDEIAKGMTMAEARLAKDPKDTAAMYAAGIAYGLRSNYFWVVKKAWHDSLKDANAARKHHKSQVAGRRV